MINEQLTLVNERTNALNTRGRAWRDGEKIKLWEIRQSRISFPLLPPNPGGGGRYSWDPPNVEFDTVKVGFRFRASTYHCESPNDQRGTQGLDPLYERDNVLAYLVIDRDTIWKHNHQSGVRCYEPAHTAGDEQNDRRHKNLDVIRSIQSPFNTDNLPI